MDFTFYCEAGSPSFIFDPRDVHGRGLGGAELSLVSLTETLASLGHSVTVYNQPPEEGVYNGVTYRHSAYFDPIERHEIFVLYRNPYPLLPYVNADVKAFFSCDQQTSGDYALDIFPFVQHTICISPYHKQYFVERYGVNPDTITAIDLGVRTWEYYKSIAKKPNSLLFCSIPDRGLEHLATIFPRIRQQIPDATLKITSSYALWGASIPDSNEKYRAMFEEMDGVTFLSKVPRERLVELQLESDILAYPNQPVGEFTELFGVSVAEAQVAGCVPITSRFGAFETTVIAPEGYVMGRHPSEKEYQNWFVHIATLLLKNRHILVDIQSRLSKKARERFNWNTIARQWLETIENVRQT